MVQPSAAARFAEGGENATCKNRSGRHRICPRSDLAQKIGDRQESRLKSEKRFQIRACKRFSCEPGCYRRRGYHSRRKQEAQNTTLKRFAKNLTHRFSRNAVLCSNVARAPPLADVSG